MSTFINWGLQSLNSRLSEIDLILAEAKNNIATNEPLYNTLCRSAQVLLSAHFEGYLKDLVKNSLEDINHFSDFKSANFYLKRRFCEYFLAPSPDERDSKGYNTKVKELISVFDNLDTKFKKEYFSYSENKNPKATVLDRIAEQYGVKNFFKQLKKSKLDLVFSNNHTDNVLLLDSIKNYLLKETLSYPYSVTLTFLEIDDSKSDKDNLWDPFLSDFLKRRHDIAHGKEIENATSHATIESDKVKIEILIYVFTAYICINSNPVTPDSIVTV